MTATTLGNYKDLKLKLDGIVPERKSDVSDLRQAN